MTRGSKAITRRKRLLSGRTGRPRLVGVERTASGRLSKAEERRRAARRERETVQVALAARRRHLGLSEADAAHHEAPVVAWRWWKRGEIQERHYNAAVALHALHADYLKAIKCPGLTPAGAGQGVSDDIDGTSPDYVAWCRRKRDHWLAIRRDLLNAGSLVLLAAHSVAVENRDMVSLVADFREAMNIVHRHVFAAGRDRISGSAAAPRS
jgi:hypothetical protein